MRKILLLFLTVIAFTTTMVAQDEVPASPSTIEAEYQKRIKKEYLNQVYIPKDLADCFIQLNKLIDSESKAKFKNAPEEAVARKLHFSLGRWMQVNWGLYEGSRLSAYLNEVGISYPDDMARFIIVSYHRNLNRKELKVKEQVDFFQEMRRKEFEAEKSRGKVIFEEKHKKVDSGQ